jgi:hypothetical protein
LTSPLLHLLATSSSPPAPRLSVPARTQA